MAHKLPVLVEQAVGAVQAESASKSMAFERLIRRDKDPTCRTGCSNCCYLPIEITVLEAIPIYRALVQKGLWTPALVAKVKDHATKTSYLSVAVWMLSGIPCPLLHNNKCQTYEVRPFHCRTMWATGDPYYCAGPNLGEQTTLVPKDELMSDFLGYEKLLADQNRFPHLTVPVGRALLFAEQICKGRIAMRDVMGQILQEAYRESE